MKWLIIVFNERNPYAKHFSFEARHQIVFLCVYTDHDGCERKIFIFHKARDARRQNDIQRSNLVASEKQPRKKNFILNIVELSFASFCENSL